MNETKVAQWKIREKYPTERYHCICVHLSDDGSSYATVKDMDQKRGERFASMIESVPELFELLERVEHLYEQGMVEGSENPESWTSSLLNDVRAAIARATGTRRLNRKGE